jgi:hypothetical protein
MSFVANPREAKSHLFGELLAEFARPLSDAFVVTMMRRAAARSWIEDTKGKGHKDHATSDDELLLALIPVPDGMTIESLMDRKPG